MVTLVRRALQLLARADRAHLRAPVALTNTATRHRL